MADRLHSDHSDSVVNAVDDAVVLHAHPKEISSGQLCRTQRARFFTKSLNSVKDASSQAWVHSEKLFLHTSLYLNRITHKVTIADFAP